MMIDTVNPKSGLIHLDYKEDGKRIRATVNARMIMTVVVLKEEPATTRIILQPSDGSGSMHCYDVPVLYDTVVDVLGKTLTAMASV